MVSLFLESWILQEQCGSRERTTAEMAAAQDAASAAAVRSDPAKLTTAKARMAQERIMLSHSQARVFEAGSGNQCGRAAMDARRSKGSVHSEREENDKTTHLAHLLAPSGPPLSNYPAKDSRAPDAERRPELPGATTYWSARRPECFCRSGGFGARALLLIGSSPAALFHASTAGPELLRSSSSRRRRAAEQQWSSVSSIIRAVRPRRLLFLLLFAVTGRRGSNNSFPLHLLRVLAARGPCSSYSFSSYTNSPSSPPIAPRFPRSALWDSSGRRLPQNYCAAS